MPILRVGFDVIYDRRYKGSKTFSAMQIFIVEIACLPFKFSVSQGCKYQQHKVLWVIAKLWENAVCEPRFLKYVRNSAYSFMTVFFLS